MVDTLWRGGLCTTALCSRKLPISDYFKNSHYRVAEATLSGAWIMGNAFAFSGDFNKALNAAKRVFQLLDRYVDLVDAEENYQLFRKPRIDANQAAGLKLKQVNVGYRC